MVSSDAQSYHALVIAPQAVAVNKVHFDLFSASATMGVALRLRQLRPIVATDVAVTGLVGVGLNALRTNSIGTGGTAAAVGAAVAPAVNPLDSLERGLPTTVTARQGPTAGATSAHVLAQAYEFTEESAVQAQIAQGQNLIDYGDAQTVIRPGEGFKVVQGAVAGVGSIGFVVIFSVHPQ